MFQEKNQELKLIRDHINLMTKMNETTQIAGLRQDLKKLQGRTPEDYFEGVLYSKGGAPGYLANKKGRNSNVVLSQIHDDHGIFSIAKDNQNQAHLQRLIDDREQLVLQGYAENDPLIMTMNQEIKRLQNDDYGV